MSPTNEFPPAPIPVLTPSLVTSLRERTQAVLSYLVETNSISTFFNESGTLSDFRNAVKLRGESDAAFETFHDNVPFSLYEHYLPFVSRLFEKPCRMTSIENLMSPGFPVFIAHSSGTSSGTTKYFPKYRHPEHMSTSTSETMKASSTTSKFGGMNCIVYSLRHTQVVDSLSEDGDVKLRMPVCLMSTGTIRMFNNMVRLPRTPSLVALSCSQHVDRDPLYRALRGMRDFVSRYLAKLTLLPSPRPFFPVGCLLHPQLQVLPLHACAIRRLRTQNRTHQHHVQHHFP